MGPTSRGQEVIFWSRVLGKEVLGERRLTPSHVYLNPAPSWLNRLSFIGSPIKPSGRPEVQGVWMDAKPGYCPQT